MRTAAALLVFCAALGAQQSSTLSLDNGVELRLTADFGTPTGQETLTVEMARASGNSVYRVFRDQNNLAVYAYQIFFDISGSGDSVFATAKPYDDRFASRFPYADAGKPTPTLATSLPLGPITSGHAASISLFSIPGMGLDVHETISVEIDPPNRGGALHLSGLAVAINGKTVQGEQQQPVSGRYAMFYVPGRGAYFISASDPGHGFVKSGAVDGNHMSFSVDNNQYDCHTDAPILSGANSGELWVLHDANYRPAGNWTTHPRSDKSGRPAADQFFAAAADSLAWWLP